MDYTKLASQKPEDTKIEVSKGGEESHVVEKCCGSPRRVCLKFKYWSFGSTLLGAILLFIPIIFLNLSVVEFTQSLCKKIILLSIANILDLISLYFYFNVSTLSPGYADTSTHTSYEDYKKNPPVVKIKNVQYALSYCQTCKIIRQPRVFHCRICNKCILKHDHHCGFVNNCIGKNNYKYFFYFITSTMIYSLFGLGLNVYLSLLLNFNFNTNKEIIVLTLLISYIIAAFILVFFFFSHVGLISSGRSTSESIRKRYKPDAFDEGCKNNWKNTFK